MIALAAAIVGLGLYMLDPAWLQRLDLRTVDARLAVQDGHAADPRVALIAVDDADPAAARAGSNGRLPRSDYATHPRPGPARRAGRHGARRDLPDGGRPGRGSTAAVGHPQVGPGARAAVRRGQPAGADARPTATRPPGRCSSDATQPAAFRTGFAGLPDDPDGTIRRANLVVDIGRRACGGHEHADVRVHRRGHRPGRRAARAGWRSCPAHPARGRSATSRATARPGSTSPAARTRASRTSAVDVLDGDGLRRARSATSSSSSASRRAAPPTSTARRSTRRMPGVELQAAAIATMFRRRPRARHEPARRRADHRADRGARRRRGAPVPAAAQHRRDRGRRRSRSWRRRSTCSRSRTWCSPWPRRCSRWRSRSSASWRSTPSAPRAGTPGVNTTPAAGFSDPAGASARAH